MPVGKHGGQQEDPSVWKELGETAGTGSQNGSSHVMGRDENAQVEPGLCVPNNLTNQVSWRRLHLIVRPHPDQQILKTATDAASRGPHIWLTSASCTVVLAGQVLHKLSRPPFLSTRPHVLGYYFPAGPCIADLGGTLTILWLRREVCDLVINNY